MDDEKALLATVREAVSREDWAAAKTSFAKFRGVTTWRAHGDLYCKLVSKALDLKDRTTAGSVLQALALVPPPPKELLDYGVKQQMDLLARWSDLVGRFMMSFGQIEAVTYYGLKTLPRDPIFESVVNMSFASRIDLLKALIAGRRDGSPTLADWLVELLDQAKELAKVRNLVAHNPIQMSAYEDADGKHTFVEEITHHTSDSRKLSYEDMRQNMIRAIQLENELQFTMRTLMQMIPDQHGG